jgi:hypothetical protein
MDPRLVPVDENGWKDFDESKHTQDFASITIKGFKFGAGQIPTIRRFDSITKSVGIMLGVNECWPKLAVKLCEEMWTSLGSGLSYLKDERYGNFLDLRIVYFSVIRSHMLPQAQALNQSLTILPIGNPRTKTLTIHCDNWGSP